MLKRCLVRRMGVWTCYLKSMYFPVDIPWKARDKVSKNRFLLELERSSASWQTGILMAVLKLAPVFVVLILAKALFFFLPYERGTIQSVLFYSFTRRVVLRSPDPAPNQRIGLFTKFVFFPSCFGSVQECWELGFAIARWFVAWRHRNCGILTTSCSLAFVFARDRYWSTSDPVLKYTGLLQNYVLLTSPFRDVKNMAFSHFFFLGLHLNAWYAEMGFLRTGVSTEHGPLCCGENRSSCNRVMVHDRHTSIIDWTCKWTYPAPRHRCWTAPIIVHPHVRSAAAEHCYAGRGLAFPRSQESSDQILF